MLSKIYVDVPGDYPYKWELGDLADDVLSRDFDVKITFICNHAARISEGDVHMVEFNSEGEELLFLLKSPFKLLNKEVVEDYINKRRLRNETSYRSPRS